MLCMSIMRKTLCNNSKRLFMRNIGCASVLYILISLNKTVQFLKIYYVILMEST